jgi:hypothetical protein
LNNLPHINKILITVWAQQKYLSQELAHQCDVRKSLAHKVPFAFGSFLAVPITKTDFKCSCDNEVRYLDFTHFSQLRQYKEAVKFGLFAVSRPLDMAKRFLVAAQTTYAIPTNSVAPEPKG